MKLRILILINREEVRKRNVGQYNNKIFYLQT